MNDIKRSKKGRMKRIKRSKEANNFVNKKVNTVVNKVVNFWGNGGRGGMGENNMVNEGGINKNKREMKKHLRSNIKGFINNNKRIGVRISKTKGYAIQYRNGKVYKSASTKNNSMYPGDLQGSPDESFKESLVFIDETFLEKLSKYFGDGKYLKFDKILFSINLAKKQNLNCKNIFYYTAPPFQSPVPTIREKKRKDGYDKFLDKLRRRGVIVREGRCQRLKSEDKFVYKQKAVDILLAMDLMSVPLDHPFVEKIILISSDSDFVPVIESLEKKGVKTILYTYYEKIRDTPFSVSNYIIKSVYKYVLLIREDFNNCPLKKEVENEK